jgi:DinB superfamily
LNQTRNQTGAHSEERRKPIITWLVNSNMPSIYAVDGSPLAPESVRMLEYLQTRAEELSAAAICERIRAAARELENAVAAVSASEARMRPIEGKWTIAEVVDHISQTQVRGAEELRHLLSGVRPPLPPVYEALRSGAGQWAPWELLVAELHDANRAMVELLETASGEPPAIDAPTVRTVVVALRKRDDGATEPQIFFAELGWKQYALLQRLHLLDHRTQVKNLHAHISKSS